MERMYIGIRFMLLSAVLVLAAACGGAATTPEVGTPEVGTGVQPSPSPSPGVSTGGGVTSSPLSQSRQADLMANVGDRVFFKLDRSNLDETARATLGRQAAWLKLNPAVTVTLEGHADERGTREYNIALGSRRANSAETYLVSLGVDPARLRTISYGKERPVALCAAESCWKQNRRVVMVVN